jgi:hypothetical protein
VVVNAPTTDGLGKRYGCGMAAGIVEVIMTMSPQKDVINKPEPKVRFSLLSSRRPPPKIP